MTVIRFSSQSVAITKVISDARQATTNERIYTYIFNLYNGELFKKSDNQKCNCNQENINLSRN